VNFSLVGDNVDVTSTVSNGTTTYKLIATGVASGTYNWANVTVSTSGRITAIAQNSTPLASINGDTTAAQLINVSGPGLSTTTSAGKTTIILSTSTWGLGSLSILNSPLPIANGGTATSATPGTNQLMYFDGTFIRGTSTVAAVGDNPSATIGTSTQNGSAATFMRSDAAPAFSQTLGYTFSALGNTTSSANISASTIVASTSITNAGVKSALVLNSAAGLEGAYAGAAACANAGMVSTISAVGATTCISSSTQYTNLGLGTMSLQAVPAAGVVTSNGTTISSQTNTLPTVATTTKGVYDSAPSSTDDIVIFYTETAFTLKQVDCINDNFAGNTVAFNITWGSTRNATNNNAFTVAQTCSNTSTIQTIAINGSTSVAAGSIIRLVASTTAASVSSTGAYVDIKF
jgi:hypothetical protein